MNPRQVIAILVLACAGCAARPLCGQTTCPPGTSPAWDAFWRAHGVLAAPPFDFLDSPPATTPAVLNRTDGRLDDQTVRRWLCGGLRRSRGAKWAEQHLRTDLVNAGV